MLDEFNLYWTVQEVPRGSPPFPQSREAHATDAVRVVDTARRSQVELEAGLAALRLEHPELSNLRNEAASLARDISASLETFRCTQTDDSEPYVCGVDNEGQLDAATRALEPLARSFNNLCEREGHAWPAPYPVPWAR